MTSVTRLFSHVSALFCAHEWARRVAGRRIYLECVHCLSTTPGLVVEPRPARRAPARCESEWAQEGTYEERSTNRPIQSHPDRAAAGEWKPRHGAISFP